VSLNDLKPAANSKPDAKTYLHGRTNDSIDNFNSRTIMTLST
jgi:hypothetical protein